VNRRLASIPVTLGLSILACGAPSSVPAATWRVDDSATLPGEATTAMHWRSVGPTRRDGAIVDGATVVTLVLNTAPWLHRIGRIYMFLPEQSIGSVAVSWQTQGRLRPGSLVSGQRTLVYAGPITGPRITDTLAVSVSADGRRLVSPQRLEFQFQIDVE